MKPAIALSLLFASLIVFAAGAADVDPARVLPAGQKPQDARLDARPHPQRQGLRLHAARSTSRPGKPAARSCASRSSSPTACGRCRRRRRSTPSFTARSTATTTPSRRSSSPATPGHYVSGNLYRPKGKTRQSCPASSARTATGPTAASTTPARRPPRSRSTRRRREDDGRRPLPAPGPLRPAGPHGLRRLPLRHGRLSPTARRSPTATASPTPTPSCVCKVSWACKPGTASARSTSC